MKRFVSEIMLALLLVSTLTLAIDIRAAPTTIVVPDNYPTIQAAINAASDGDTIFVRNGTYHENVVLDKAVSLVGESSVQHPVIDGDQTVAVVKIVANRVLLKDFDVTNGGFGDSYGDGLLGGGIELFGVSDCVVANNNAYDNKACGISLVNANRNTVANNTCSGNWVGIRLWSWSPQTTSYNIIHNNTCSGNRRDGINLWSYVYMTWTVTYNNLTNNIIYENGFAPYYGCGIFIGKSVGGLVSGNTIFYNNQGIELDSSSNCQFFHNDFISCQVRIFDEEATSTNTWDNGYPSGGNYWSTYNCTDTQSGPFQNETGSDGIGDTPYTINTNNIDNYPLVHPYNPFNFVPLTITTTPGGTTKPVPGMHYYATNLTAQITAIPDVNCALDYWELDGVNVGSANPYIVLMDSKHTLKTIFSHETTPPTIVIINPINGSLILSNAVQVNGYVSDDSGVDEVRFSFNDLLSATCCYYGEKNTTIGFGMGGFTNGTVVSGAYLLLDNGTIIEGDPNEFNVTIIDGEQYYIKIFATDIFGNFALEKVYFAIRFQNASATVYIDPDTLNLRSKQQWMSAYIEFPYGYDVHNISVSTVKLNDTVSAELTPIAIGDYNNNSVPDLMVKFNRTAVLEYILSKGIMYGNVTLTVVGELHNGTRFEGSDIIGVSMPGDVNSDGEVDMFDVVPEPHYDMNEDGKIDILDIVSVTVNYRKTYP